MSNNTHQWRVYMLTWNVNRQPTPPVSDFFAQLLFPEDALESDLIVIGLQEVPFTKDYVSDVLGAEQWSFLFRKFLCRPKRPFIQLSFPPASRPRLIGTQTLVFLRENLIGAIQCLETIYCRLGYLGEKGAVGVRLTTSDDTHITFVNCHLTPHAEKLPARIKDYRTILNTIKFGDGAQTIISDDYVFFIGDLNFRVDFYSAQEAVKIAEENESLSRLWYNDQLQRCKDSGEAFEGFLEAQVFFPPTYRFLINSSSYDLQRVPSWCDRIMWRVHEIVGSNHKRPAGCLQCEMLRYDSVIKVELSDHKPVVALCYITLSSASVDSDWTVTFDLTPGQAWLMAQENRCKYRFIRPSYSPSVIDWIALYKSHIHMYRYTTQSLGCFAKYGSVPSMADFQSDVEDVVTWMYHMSSWQEVMTDESGTVQENLLFKNQYFTTTGVFRLGYFSRARNCLIGLSHPFEIINSKLDEVEAVDETEN